MSAVRYVVRRRARLVLASLALMAATPYLGSFPVRNIPSVVALASGGEARSGELDLFLGARAGDLGWVLAALTIGGALAFLLTLASTRVSATLTALATRDLRLALFRRLLGRRPSELGEGNVGNLTRSALLDQSRAVALYATSTLPAVIGVTVAVVVWGQTLRGSLATPGTGFAAAAVTLGAVGVLAVVNMAAVALAAKKSQAGQRVVIAEQAAFIGAATESITHLRELQLNVAEQAQVNRLEAVLDRMTGAQVRVATWGGLASASAAGAVLLGIPILILVWRALDLGGAQLAVMIPALLMLQRSVSSAGSLWTSYRVSQPAVELVSGLMGETGVPEPGARADSDADGGARVELRDVAISIGDRVLFDGADLIVEPGETVALVGAGGSGKSTLLRLILRLGESDRGDALIDGDDVTSLALADLRSQVGLLDQHPAFFSRTLRENLLLDGREADDDEIAAVAAVARAFEIVERVGLDGNLSSDQSALSGSERRRLALTRVLLRRPRVLLVDELEAGLPQALARDIWTAVREHTADTTCLFVTHRPDLLAADRVAFVHERSIFTTGSHEELWEDCPPYRELVESSQKEASDE